MSKAAQTPTTPETKSSEDLLSLGDQLEHAWAIEKRLWQEACMADIDVTHGQAQIIEAPVTPIAKKIIGAKATTLAELKVKARVIQWIHKEDHPQLDDRNSVEANGVYEFTVAQSILDDLLSKPQPDPTQSKVATTEAAPFSANKEAPKSDISRCAEEIANLNRLTLAIDEKHAITEGENTMLEQGCSVGTFLKHFETEALDRIEALKQAASLMEPQTLDDVLTLAIILATETNNLLEWSVSEELEPHVNHVERTPRDQSAYRIDYRQVVRLHRTILNGLREFASSPLAGDPYWFKSWSSEVSTVDEELEKMAPSA